MPLTILKMIRHKTFNFLWSGASKNEEIHLVRCDKSSLSKAMGGCQKLTMVYLGIMLKMFMERCMRIIIAPKRDYSRAQ